MVINMVTMMIRNVGFRGKYHLVFLLDFFSFSLFLFLSFPRLLHKLFSLSLSYLIRCTLISLLASNDFVYWLVIFIRKIDLHEIRVVIKELSNAKSFFFSFWSYFFYFFFSLTDPSKKQIKLFFRARATLRNTRRHACNGT